MLYKPSRSPHWHYDFQIKGVRYCGSTYVPDKSSAKLVEAEARRNAASPKRDRPVLTLDEAAGFYSDRAQDKPSWPTNRYFIRELLKLLGKTRLLSDISQRDLVLAVAKRRNGRANSSVNREIVIWRALWRCADKLRFDVGEMPDWSSLLLPIPAQAPKSFDRDQEKALFANLRADLHPLAEFALASGWRVSEVRSLLWSDIDFPARMARTRVKGGDVIERPLSTAMLALIASQPRVCPQVFTYEAQSSRCRHVAKDGRKRAARKAGDRYPFSKSGWRKPWTAALAAAGIDDLCFHTLRHTRGRRLTGLGVSLQTIAGALGHKSIKTTMKYASASAEDVRSALDLDGGGVADRDAGARPSGRKSGSAA